MTKGGGSLSPNPGGEEGAIFFEVRRYGEVESTNDLAFELASAGCPEGTTVLADSQSRGRGRRGRRWHSPPGTNLYFSFLLVPGRDRREWPDLSWVIAGAVARVLAARGVPAVAIKNPNDVLAGGRKIAGVLLENRVGPSEPPPVVAGVGINVNTSSRDLPDDLRERTTSLREETGCEADREELLQEVLRSLAEGYRLWTAQGAGEARRRLEEEGIGFAGFGDEGRK